MRNFRVLASWLLALAVAATLVQMSLHPLPDPPQGYVKLFDRPGEHFVFTQLAERSGLTLFEPAGRFVAGLLEVLTALLLVLPFSRRAGALLSSAIALTGVGLHLSPWLGREIAIGGGATDGGVQFLVMVTLLAASLLLLVVHPARRERR